MKTTKRKSKFNLLLSVSWVLLLFCLTNLASVTTKEAVQQTVIEAEEFSKEWSSDSYRRSIDLFKKALKDWETLGEFQESSKCLRKSAKIYLKLSDFDDASNQLTEAFKIDSQLGDWEAKTEDMSLLSLVYLRAGKVKESENAYKQALQLSLKSENTFIRATALFSAAQYSYSYGNTEETIKLFQETLTFADKANDKSLVAQSLLYLAFSHIKNGNPTMSLENAQRALAILEELNDKRGQAICYVGLGFINTMLNEKQDALNAYKKGEILFPDDFEWLEKGKLYNGLATVYEEYNQLKLAENYRRKALECYQKSKYLYGQLATLPTLASVVYKNGDTISANGFYDEALELANKLNDDYHLAYIKKDLGKISLEMGLPDEAIKNFVEVEKLYLKLNTKFPEVQESIGEAYQKKGNSNLARNFFNLAQKISHETREILVEAEILHKLANLDAIENKTDEALKNIKNSLDITETLYSDIINSNLKRTYFSNVYDRYELYTNLLVKMHQRFPTEGYDIQALQAAEKSRARSLLETLRLSEAKFTKDADPELVQKEKEIRTLLNLKADKLTELLSSNAEKAETDKLDNEINSLQNELEDIKGKLKANSPVYSAIENPSAFDVQDFQANVLDDKTLLLEFSFGAEESYLWLVGKNEVSHFILPKREILDLRIQKLLDLLKAREISEGEEPEHYQKRLIDAESEYESEARLLSNELFGQIADKLAGKRLIIVPDGKLYYFPISALPLPNADDNEPMLQTNEIVYEPSAATLQILGKTVRPEKVSPKELLVFADPIFSLQDNRLLAENKNPTDENDSAFLGSSLRSFEITDSNNQFSRLFATQQEAESIAKIVGASNTTIASGFAANRQRVFEKDVSDYKIIHFATHGLMNDTRPELSGIVLSLFDEKGEAQKGFIRLQDIYSLNLSADLVVLSACQSGIGKKVKGEGLMSLTGGFIQSGANSVLSSLWKVDDYATSELMENFYQELAAKNLAPSEALRNAQIKMRQNPNFKSPFYWAAFTVQGEFRQPISVNKHRFSYLWIVLSAILIGLVIYFIFRFVKATSYATSGN